MERAVERAGGEVTRAERALYRAMILGNLNKLGVLLADDLTYIHSTAVVESKLEYLRGVGQGLYEYAEIRSHAVRTRVHGDLAVQTGIVTMSVSARGAPKEQLSLVMTLAWRRDVDVWRLFLRQATRRPP